MDWTNVITHPLGLTGYGLAAVFVITNRVIGQKGKSDRRWVIFAAFALATVCILGGLALGYRSQSAVPQSKSQVVAAPSASMHVDRIEQRTEGGSAIAGVQGNVTVNAPASRKESTPKK